MTRPTPNPGAFTDVLGNQGRLLLGGVVGSTAYGLNHATSDQDRLGVFVYPTTRFHGLHLPTKAEETITQHEPSDVTMQEVGKMVRLLLGANPTVTELLWLPEDLYDYVHPFGADLIAMRASFLSADRVRDAYLGYAFQQFTRLEKRGNFDSGGDKRVKKAARHVLRLLHQGYDLYTTGSLTVRLADPERYFAFGELSTEEMLTVFRQEEERFKAAISVLPEHPDTEAADAFLKGVRRAFIDLS